MNKKLYDDEYNLKKTYYNSDDIRVLMKDMYDKLGDGM